MSVRRFYSRERCFRHANFVSITRIGPFLSNTLDDSSPVRMWATNLVWAARSCRVTQIKRSVTFERSIWLAIFHVNELIESIDFFSVFENWTVGRCPNSTCIFISIRIIHCFFSFVLSRFELIKCKNQAKKLVVKIWTVVQSPRSRNYLIGWQSLNSSSLCLKKKKELGTFPFGPLFRFNLVFSFIRAYIHSTVVHPNHLKREEEEELHDDPRDEIFS